MSDKRKYDPWKEQFIYDWYHIQDELLGTKNKKKEQTGMNLFYWRKRCSKYKPKNKSKG